MVEDTEPHREVFRRVGALWLHRRLVRGNGTTALAKDFVTHVDMLVLLDAKAARGIIERNGSCTVRHIDTDHFWLQQQQARRLLPIQHVHGTSNIADLLAKHLADTYVGTCVQMMEMEFSSRRSAAAAQLHDVRPGKVHGDSWDEVCKRGCWR